MTARTREVVIVGGGPAGCATALALCERGVENVLVVDAGDPAGVRVGESIPPAARPVLERLGLWEAFVGEEHEPCLGSCSVWGSDEPGFNDFVFDPHGVGWHLDRSRFDGWLARAAAARGAELLRGARATAVRRDGEASFRLRLTATTGSPETVAARVVVDASGSGSRLARMLGSRQRKHDRLSIVTAFLEGRACCDWSRLTTLEAVEYGWWYAARLPRGRLAVAVASDPAIVKQASLHTRPGWLAALRGTRHLGAALPDADIGGAGMVARSARSFVLDRPCGRDWLAVGDASFSCDPLSSQGIHNALRDGLQAGALIAARLAGDRRALDGHHASVAAGFADYLGARNHLYGLERRWPAAPFWRRRQARVEAR